MTTFVVSTLSGPLTAEAWDVPDQDATISTAAAAPTQPHILADGILFLLATLISRVYVRVFRSTVYTAYPVEFPDYYYPPSCCV